MKIGGAFGCSVFAKRETTKEGRTTIGESNIVEMSRREDGLDPVNRAFAQTGAGPVTVQIPKFCTQSGKPVSCRSVLVSPYVFTFARPKCCNHWSLGAISNIARQLLLAAIREGFAHLTDAVNGIKFQDGER
ncbi:MAG: hypothetical protein ACI85V_000663 [bacterium]